MTRTLLVFVLLCCLLCSPAFAQYNSPENMVWVMGNGSGVDFSGTVPAPVNTGIKSSEGCASVCNDAGVLLFYTNGSEVWNANGSFMPNGQDITGTGIGSTLSSTQGALIVPDINRCGIYYIFSLAPEGVGSLALYCSRVNMDLANGSGDVDTTFSLWQMPIKSGLSEKMVAIKSREEKKIWILVHHASEPEFYAFPFSAAGPDTVSVNSVAGQAAPYVQGAMKVNPVSDQIAVCNQAPGSSLALYDFNGTSGNVTFARMIDSACAAYSGTFSPDGTKLYVRSMAGNFVQYNLNVPYPAPAKTLLGPGKLTDMRLAPNGKIYFVSWAGLGEGMYYLGSIESPNSTGIACQLRDSLPNLVFPQITPTISRLNLGLPNEVVGRASYSSGNETVYNRKYCSFPSGGILFQAESGYNNYLWDNGMSGSSRSVSQAGIYWVSYNTYCGPKTDTFKVAVEGLPALHITYNNGMLSVANIYTDYQWYLDGMSIPGANLSSYMATSTGLYSVLVHKDNLCTDSAALQVTNLTGINNSDKDYDISIFPNPAQDHIYITAAAPVSYCLYSIDGKVMLLGNGNHIDVTTIAQGLYILKLTDKAGRYLAVQKIRIK